MEVLAATFVALRAAAAAYAASPVHPTKPTILQPLQSEGEAASESGLIAARVRSMLP